MPIIGWVLANFKTVMMVGGAIALMFFIWKAYDIVNENASLKVTNAVQQVTIQNQRDIITKQIQINDLKDQVIDSRDKELQALDERMKNILVNLGEDSKDPAPESLKELFRRLQ